MKVKDLKRQLKPIPDDAEITYKKYLNDNRVALVFSLGSELWQIYFKEYQGLPK